MDIYENIKAGKYEAKMEEVRKKKDNNFIFDENQTVVWNRAEVEKYNDSIEKAKKVNRERRFAAAVLFEEDVKGEIKNSLKCNEAQAQYIFNKAKESPFGDLDGNKDLYEQVEYLAEAIAKFQRLGK